MYASTDYTNTDELPSTWIPIRGDSMWPSLKAGDEAKVLRARRRFNVGDVVVARVGQGFVAHRVVAHTNEAVLLKGDNCERLDPPVKHDAIFGSVVQIRRRASVLDRHNWDLGPRRLGRWRILMKQRLQKWIGGRR